MISIPIRRACGHITEHHDVPPGRLAWLRASVCDRCDVATTSTDTAPDPQAVVRALRPLAALLDAGLHPPIYHLPADWITADHLRPRTTCWLCGRPIESSDPPVDLCRDCQAIERSATSPPARSPIEPPSAPPRVQPDSPSTPAPTPIRDHPAANLRPENPSPTPPSGTPNACPKQP